MLFGKKKDNTPKVSAQELIDQALAENNFTPTSSYKQSTGPLGKVRQWQMFVDSQGKRLAFATAAGKVTFFNFDQIRDCELQQQVDSNSTTGSMVGFGPGALGSSRTVTKIRYVRVFLHTNDIDNPSFEMVLAIFCSSNSSDYLGAVNFANQVKTVVDNIIAMRG